MNCPNCGAPLAEGAAFCGTCGMPIQQPQQPGMQQPNMQYQQPGMQQPNMQYQQPGMQQPNMQYQQPGMQQPNMQYQQPGMQQQWQAQQPTGSYAPKGNIIEMIKSKPILIVTYVGFFFILITSFLKGWVTAKVYGITSSEGLLVTGGGILKLYALLFALIAIWGILVEFGSFIPAINGIVDKFKKLPYSQFYLPCLAFIVWLLSILNGEFRDLVKISGIHYGICMYLNIIGILMIAARPVIALIQKKNYWEEG